MEKSGVPFRVEEELADTNVLFIDNGFPFLATRLRQKFEEKGCDVDTTPALSRRYTYVVVFGLSRKILKSFQKNKPYFSRYLKPGGKAIVVVSQQTHIPKEKIPVKTFVLNASKTFSPEALSEKILKVLFTSRPIHHEEKKQIIKPAGQYDEKQHIRAFPVKRIISIFCITLLLSPIIVYILGITLNLIVLQQTLDFSKPLANRKSLAMNVKQIQPVTALASTVLEKSTLIVPQLSSAIEGTTTLNNSLTNALIEGLSLEELMLDKLKTLSTMSSTDLENNLGSISGKVGAIEEQLALAEEATQSLIPFKNMPLLKQNWPKIMQISDARKIVGHMKELLPILPQLLGFEGEKKYLLLFQNNFELRPTGGFIGSYGLASIRKGALSAFHIEDIYEADGQLKGQVAAPLPLKEHLNQPNWFLRDSNWNPDFRESAKQAEWFLQKETDTTVDGVIAIDLYFVKNILEVLGQVYVPDYQANVTADDFFIKLQSDTHENFFPGSTKKKDLLRSLASALIIELKDRKSLPYSKLITKIEDSFAQKHLLLYVHDKNGQDVMEKLGWAGRLVQFPDIPSSLQPVIIDYMLLVDSNVGVNKVNYYIEREIFTTVALTPTELGRETVIYFKNKSPREVSLFSGDYKNYMRLLVPKSATLKEVKIDDKKVAEDDIAIEIHQEKSSIGFLVLVPKQKEVKVVITYALPLPVGKRITYQLIAQKQPGTNADPFVFKVDPSGRWKAQPTNFPSFPYLNNLRVDRLLTVDFVSQIE